MARVEILPSLEEEINKKFKKESVTVFEFLKTLEKEPKKGKPLGVVGGIAIKELKYKSFRFYFIADAHKIQFLNKEELHNLLIRFVRMSNKKYQQENIDEIRKILLSTGFEII